MSHPGGPDATDDEPCVCGTDRTCLAVIHGDRDPLDDARSRLAHAAHDAGFGQQVTVSADDLAAVLNAFPDLDLPEPTDVRPDRMAVWDDPGRWIVMQEADGTKWVHVHTFDPRGGLYGHSYTFSAELAAVIGAAAARPIAPDNDYDCPF